MLTEIEAPRPTLEIARRAVSVLSRMPAYDKGEGTIDWAADPSEIYVALRNLWQYVDLDPATFEPTRPSGMTARSRRATWSATHRRTWADEARRYRADVEPGRANRGVTGPVDCDSMVLKEAPALPAFGNGVPAPPAHKNGNGNGHKNDSLRPAVGPLRRADARGAVHKMWSAFR